MQWGEEHDAELARLHNTMSFSLIAAAINRRFGTEYSRNAVIGRAHRMGLINLKSKAISRMPRRPRSTRAAGPLTQKLNRLKQQFDPKVSAEPFEPRAADIVSLRKTIVEVVMFAECHWADDEPNAAGQMTFCGHPTRIGTNWCEAHQRIVWQPHQARAKQSPIYREARRRAA